MFLSSPALSLKWWLPCLFGRLIAASNLSWIKQTVVFPCLFFSYLFTLIHIHTDETFSFLIFQSLWMVPPPTPSLKLRSHSRFLFSSIPISSPSARPSALPWHGFLISTTSLRPLSKSHHLSPGSCSILREASPNLIHFPQYQSGLSKFKLVMSFLHFKPSIVFHCT